MTDDRDQRLALLLEETTRRQQNGQPIDWAALRRDHADLADELRQLLAVGDVVQGLATSGAPPTLSQAGLKHRPNAPLALPCAIGDFELQAEIGRGGMGVVYQAWDKKLQRPVALKMISRGEQASSTDLARFRGEAGAAAGLNHPNIVPVYQVGEHDGQPYFVMKLAPGRTLSALVKDGPLPPRRAAELVRAIAEAVQHAHAHGILHRDLKPSNILIDSDEQPLITDFGLAKRTATSPSLEGGARGGGASLTGTGAILGTPSYMAPEQADVANRQAGPGIDIYSLGAILYELLTGRPPFLAATPLETLLLVRSEEPVRPRALNPRIDVDLELICRRCLEKRPEHRYASAADLARDLQAYLNAEPVSARSNSLVYFVTRLFRDSYHAPVLENWGLLWMLQSLVIILICVVTSQMYALDRRDPVEYLALWGPGLALWAAWFWQLRRRGGPVTFVERQIAHAWGAGVAASAAMFVIEWLLGIETLKLSPMLGVIAGMVFLVKAGTLSGWFYIAAAASFAVAIPMALAGPRWGLILFGAVSALGFFVPGLKYYRQRRAQQPKL